MLEKLKNKYIQKLSSIVGDSPIILLFSIYITLFIFIQNISIFRMIVALFLLVCILKLSSFQKFIKLIFVAIILLSISVIFLPGTISEGAHVVVGEVVSIENNNYDLKITKSNNESLKKPVTVKVYEEIDESNIGSKSIVSLYIKPLRISSNPGQFSSKKYLESIGISSLGYDCNFIESVSQSKIKYLAIKIRKYLYNRFAQMPKNLHSISKAMLFGDKTDLGNDIKDNYATAGLAHLLVVSGLHLTILVTLIKLFLNKFSIKVKNQAVILLLFIWSYAYITGFSYSILRASIMISTLLIVNSYNKNISKSENIALAAILILTIHPYALKNIGWQLSFLATFGLLILSSKIEKKLLRCSLRKPLSAILSVQIMTIPLVINTFNTLSLLTIPANLIMVPFTSILLIIGLITILPIFNSILMPIFTILVEVHLNITAWIAKLSHFIIFIKSWPILLVLIYYLLIFIYFFTSLKNLKKLILITFLVVLLVANIEFYPEVVFLDVGQGDCTYISTGSFNGNKKILVDGGNLSNYVDSGENVIIPFLKSKGVKEIDILIISHPHKDHIGGILSLIDSIKIEELYLSYQAYKSEKSLLVEIIDKCKDKGIRIRLIKKDDELVINKNAKINVLHPKLLNGYFDENNSSLVLNISLEKINILFTGDIEKNAEDYLVKKYNKELEADILKIPHHGSKTSSNKSFIEKVNPSIAVNSSGRNHFLNHPDKEVIMRYNDKRVNVFRTDTDGAIIIKIVNPLNIYSYLTKKEERIWLQQQWKS